MIDAVIFFGLINVCFEFVVLSMVPPRARLRLLGNKQAQVTLHIVIMVLVLWVHWGTVTGTMSAFFSFILSMFTVGIARLVFGYIENGVYHRRIIGYTVAELQTDAQRTKTVQATQPVQAEKTVDSQLAKAQAELDAVRAQAKAQREAMELGMWMVSQGHDGKTIKALLGK